MKPNSAVAKSVISSAKRRDVNAASVSGLSELEDEVAVAGGVDGVGGGRSEAELARGDVAIEREGRAGDGARA